MNEPLGACYAGSFDPLTLGHLDLIRRAHALFPRLIVAIGQNASKQPLLSAERRKALIEAEVADLPGVRVVFFEGLVVDLCREQGCSVLVRGVRTASDFEAEMTMASANRHFGPEIETVILPTSPAYAHVSSRLVKEVLRAKGALDDFVPESVIAALRD